MKEKTRPVGLTGLIVLMDPGRNRFFMNIDTWAMYKKSLKKHPFGLAPIKKISAAGGKSEISFVGAPPHFNTDVFMANLRLHLPSLADVNPKKCGLRIITTGHPNGDPDYKHMYFETQIADKVIFSRATEVNGTYDLAAQELRGIFKVLSGALKVKVIKVRRSHPPSFEEGDTEPS